MKTWKKIAIGAGAVFTLAVVAGIVVHQSHKNIVTVQTGKVQRMDLAAVVSASGEIKPKTYVNIGANAFGKITKLYAKEGDNVKKGQLLAQLENVQSSADVNANRASLEAAKTDLLASEAGLNTAKADLNRAESDSEKAQYDWARTQGLYKDALIAKQDYDSQHAAFNTAQAMLAQSKAKVAQAKAQRDSAERHITENSANLTRVSDVLQKTTYAAPFDGIITNLPVREGETVVIGIQNSPGSTLMTLSDMSVITAEVLMDETDIVNVKLGQTAEVAIDALPKQTFHAVVTQIGDDAIVRSTGVATSQTTASSQEAKDFKVVVTLKDPPRNLRPGLSCTAKVTTETRSNVLSVPIQAITVRTAADLKEKPKNGAVEVAASAKQETIDKTEVEGVFVVRSKKAQFVPVQTGIAGTTDIEITKGLQEGDELITGSYKILRTIRPGTGVKIDNAAPKKEDEES